MPTYPLWCWLVAYPLGDGTSRAVYFVTRARSQNEAHDFVRYTYGDFVTALPIHDLPIGAAERYSATHADGWLERPPEWLVREKKVIRGTDCSFGGGTI